MSKLNLFSFISTATLLSLALVSPAAATTMTTGGTTVAGEGVESSQAGAVTVTFDGLTALPAGFTSTMANPLVIGTVVGSYAAPTGDTSTYLSTGVGTITETLSGVNYFGFYWGSPDDTNTFTLTDSTGAVFSYSAASLPGGASSTGIFVNFLATPGTTFTKATFYSYAPSFEFDNTTTAVVAAATTTPEPGTLMLLTGGFIVAAGALRRRRS